MKPQNILILVLISLFAILLLQNSEIVFFPSDKTVTFKLLLFDIGISQSVLINFVMVVVFLIGYLTGSRSIRKSQDS